MRKRREFGSRSRWGKIRRSKLFHIQDGGGYVQPKHLLQEEGWVFAFLCSSFPATKQSFKAACVSIIRTWPLLSLQPKRLAGIGVVIVMKTRRSILHDCARVEQAHATPKSAAHVSFLFGFRTFHQPMPYLCPHFSTGAEQNIKSQFDPPALISDVPEVQLLSCSILGAKSRRGGNPVLCSRGTFYGRLCKRFRKV